MKKKKKVGQAAFRKTEGLCYRTFLDGILRWKIKEILLSATFLLNDSSLTNKRMQNHKKEVNHG